MATSPITPNVSNIARSLGRIGRRRARSRDWAVRRLLAAGDVVSILLALVAAIAVAGHHAHWSSLAWSVPAVPIMLFLFKIYGMYDRDVKRIAHATADDLPWLFHAALVGSLLLWGYSEVTPLENLGLRDVLAFGVGSILFVAITRATTRAMMGHLVGAERTLLVGRGEPTQALVGTLGAHPQYQLNIIGSLAHTAQPERILEGRLITLGAIEELATVAARHDVARIIVSSGDLVEEELEELLRECRRLGLKVSILPRLSEVLGSAVEIDDVHGVTVLGLNPPWLTRSSRAIKRITDIVIATVLLLLFLPLLLLLAVAIKLESPGPVLFTQERVGKGGRHFRLLKLRTMVADAEARRDELLHLSTDPDWLRLASDPRITRLGRWLRRFSLDELPQLWNVLRGEMSLVGPRPLVIAENDRVGAWGRGRLDLVPGMTGYWQVLGRTEIPFEEMVKLDYLYVVNWSLWQDIRLMLRTLPAVIRGRGAQ
jgi:exopolysaccharide biosynthesis polyprenyl glycosylphosphotransferase